MKRPLRLSVLVNPGIQVKLFLACLLFGFASVFVHSIVVGGLVEKAIQDGLETKELSAELGRIQWAGVAASALVVLPGALAIGLLGVFRILGPLLRIRLFLQGLKAGRTEPCTIREGDALQEVCDLLNEVTEPLRQPAVAEATAESRTEELASVC